MSADESGFGTVAAHADGQDPRDLVRRLARAKKAEASTPLSNEAIARRAGINRDTVADFLNGKSWPQPARLDAIERGLGLAPGTFEAILEGRHTGDDLPRTEETDVLDSGMSEMVVRFSREAFGDLTPTEREEVEAAAKAAALQRIREIRGQQQ